MKMKIENLKFPALVICGALTVQAGADAVESFGQWRVAIGGAFNGGVSADLRARNLPVPGSVYRVPAGMLEEDAWGRALNHEYDGGGYIRPDSSDGWRTQNWELPESAYYPNGRFELDNAYQQVVGSGLSSMRSDNSEDRNQFGLSAEISREIFVLDGDDEHRWGVDVALAFSYFFQREVYSEQGSITRTDLVESGVIHTTVNDPAATYDYDTGKDSPNNGMYGHGISQVAFGHPSLLWENVGTPYKVPGRITGASATMNYSAWGDYQELEMLFMARPWYEITDWWRVFANLGVGVSWGRFSSEFQCEDFGTSEDFDQWDVYGVAGLGTVFRYRSFDISVDIFGRFLRDDLDVDGTYVNGSIKRSDWGVRVMAGYEF